MAPRPMISRKMPLPEWEPPLSYRRGGASLLHGLEVYYDFDWPQVCGHDKPQFRNGQALARLARSECPPGKTAALLLTARADAEERPILTDSHFLVVVNLPRYLSRATGDVAVSYYTNQLKDAIARAEVLEDLARRPEVAEAVLTVERIAAWAAVDDARAGELRSALGGGGATSGTGSEGAALLAILSGVQSADDLDPGVIAALGALFGPGSSIERRRRILRSVTDDVEGRHLASQMLQERTGDRIADARATIAEFERLLDLASTTETDMQDFIERNIWLLGFHYARMVPQQRLLAGTLDFILERVDGFQDILELKSPQDPIITIERRPPKTYAAPAPPSSHSLSGALGQALGQVHSYRDQLTRHPDAAEELVGLESIRDPLLTIVIGRADRLSHAARRTLTELNKSLHRVEVVPYDVVGRRAAAVLTNLEAYIGAAMEMRNEGG